MVYKAFIRSAVAILLTVNGVANGAITITSPANNAKLAAGPDYATDVLGDPWDMSNPEDIGIYPDERNGWATFGFPGNGTLGGKTATVGANPPYVDTHATFLYRGFYDIINPDRTGRRFPIDTSIYKKLTFKMYSGVARELPQVYWHHTSIGDPTQRPGVVFTTEETIVGSKIFTASDLTQPGTGWTSGDVLGLRLDPNGITAGQDVFFDWIRLTRADNDPNAARVPIAWNGAVGAVTVEVQDSAGTILTIATNATSPTNWNYGVVPPGTYTVRVKDSAGASTAVIRINSPPAARVTDPNETGGADFATTVLGNAWDMNSAADIAGTLNVSGVSFAGGVLSGTNTNNDPSIILFNSSNATTISTSKYRYLTYRLKVDGPFDLGAGSVARVFWSSSADANGPQITTTKDVIAWPGVDPNTPDFVTYTIDLGALTTATNGGLELLNAQPWGAAGAAAVRYLRIDPHEFPTPRSFQLDYVRLTAMREASNSFVIAYAASDANTEDLNAQVKLYYATDKNPANRQLIVSGLPLSNAGQYVWNLSSVTPGVYYLYSEVSDGLDTRGSYSTGQLRVLSPTGPAGPLDIDGNGRYDPATDGVLILRYLLGFRGNSLTNGAIGAGASRNATQILTQLDIIRPQLDVDGNGRFEATTDGLMLVRYLLGLRNPALTAGAIAAGATQQTLDQIQANIQALAP
jgi:hypothetical protein